MDPRIKSIHSIIELIDDTGAVCIRCEDESISLANLLSRIYGFAVGRSDNLVRIRVDIALPPVNPPKMEVPNV